MQDDPGDDELDQLLRQDAIGIVLSGTSRASHMQQCFSLLQQA